jgi:hypothetical protein
MRAYLLLPLVFLLGCGSALKNTYASLATAERLVVAAAEELPRFDEARQAKIIKDAKTGDEARAKLKEWRDTREKVVKGIEGAHASIQLARDAMDGISRGVGNPKDLGTWAGVAIRVYQDLMALLRVVGVELF